MGKEKKQRVEDRERSFSPGVRATSGSGIVVDHKQQCLKMGRGGKKKKREERPGGKEAFGLPALFSSSAKFLIFPPDSRHERART